MLSLLILRLVPLKSFLDIFDIIVARHFDTALSLPIDTIKAPAMYRKPHQTSIIWMKDIRASGLTDDRKVNGGTTLEE